MSLKRNTENRDKFIVSPSDILLKPVCQTVSTAQTNDTTTSYSMWWAILLLYLLNSVLITWPLAINLSSTLFGDYGDSRGTVWAAWTHIYGLSASQLIAAPFGVPVDHGFSQPVSDWIFFTITKFSNEIAAYNLIVIFAFTLTAFVTYLVIFKALHNRFAAFMGGLIFGFCPGAVMQVVGGHTTFAENFGIPLFLLALFYNQKQRAIASSFYLAVTFALITLTSLYFGYFAIYICLFFVGFDLLSSKDNKIIILRSYLIATLFALALILPFEYKAIFQQLFENSATLEKAGQIRDINELFVYSSRPWEFLVPSIDHPIFGKYVIDLVRSHLHGSNVFEQSLYMGVVPLGLLLTGFVLALRNKFVGVQRTYFLFFTLGALWMYFLSLPPMISIGDIQVPTLSFFAYKIAPMFRVYARFGILVNFFVACSAAIVLAHLYQHMKRARFIVLMAIVLPVLVVEYWSVPPGFALPVDRPPGVYSWLSKQPGDFIVAEYPMMNSDEASFYTYLFWQRIHKKKLVNGATRNNEKAWSFFEKVKDLGKSQTPDLLKSVGVKYVIVHGDMYKDGPVPSPLKRYCSDECAKTTYNNGLTPSVPYPLKLVKILGSDLVFSFDEVNNKSAQSSLSHPNGVL
jgi:hypothetical protein